MNSYLLVDLLVDLVHTPLASSNRMSWSWSTWSYGLSDSLCMGRRRRELTYIRWALSGRNRWWHVTNFTCSVAVVQSQCSVFSITRWTSFITGPMSAGPARPGPSVWSRAGRPRIAHPPAVVSWPQLTDGRRTGDRFRGSGYEQALDWRETLVVVVAPSTSCRTCSCSRTTAMLDRRTESTIIRGWRMINEWEVITCSTCCSIYRSSLIYECVL